MEMFLHHVQVSGPVGCEDDMRAFYVDVLGMAEVVKPERLRSRGGAWFRAGTAEVHVGIEDGFVPARKAHPGIAVADVEELARLVGPPGARSRGTTTSRDCAASTPPTPSATGWSSSRRSRDRASLSGLRGAARGLAGLAGLQRS